MVPSPPDSRVAQRAFFALLYFSEGAPIGYIWWAMPTRLRAAGMPVEEVAALTATLALPWAFKFLWAPAVDGLRGRRWGYRCWITLAQLIMGLTLLPLALMPLTELIEFAKWLLIAHAFSAATQDVAIDALAISTVPESERGRITGWMQAGMLVGRAVFGGLALAAERWIGAEAVVLILIGCIWFTLAVVWLFPQRATPVCDPRAAPDFLLRALLSVMRRRSTWLGFGIALTAGAAFEAAGGLMGPFLLDRSASQEEVGWFFALPVVGCMIIGAVVGGMAADRVGHARLVSICVLAVACCVTILVAGDALLGLRGRELMALSIFLYLGIGCLTASSYALFMDLTDPALGATQFSAYMGATNLCEVWAVALAGRIAGGADYPTAFSTLVVLSLAAMLLLPLLRVRHEQPLEAT